MPKARKKKTARKAPVSQKKPVSLKPKHIIHPRFHASLSPLVKHLHSLGVDMASFSNSVGVGLSQLKQDEEKLEHAAFMTMQDKKALRTTVDQLLSYFHKLTEMEDALFRKVVPLSALAKNLKRSVGKKSKIMLTNIHNMNPIFKGEKHEIVRSLVIHSADQERRHLHKQYQEILKDIEGAVGKLMALERQWNQRKSHATTRLEFLKIHGDVRKLMHDGVFRFSKALDRLYKSRIKVYGWVVRKAKRTGTPSHATVLKEYEHLKVLKNHYALVYHKHAQTLKKLYGGKK
ncbi:MAG: hypothetical protein ABIF92_01015 [archaeon]